MRRGHKRTFSGRGKDVNESLSTSVNLSCYESGPITNEFDSRTTVGNKRIKFEDSIRPGFKYTKLQEMIRMDPDDLVMHLTSKMGTFISFLNMDSSHDEIMLVAALLAKACCAEMKENKAALLAHSVRCNIMKTFSSHSFDFIALDLKYSKEELTSYFENLQKLYQEIMDVIPNTAVDLLKEHSTKAFMALQNLKALKNISISEELENKYNCLISSMSSMIKEDNSGTGKNYRAKGKQEWYLGADFRELSIHPQPQDLLDKSALGLFPAVIKGPYKSVEHYLDIQFKLLRGDFLIPLRDGIADFIEQKSSKTNRLKRVENVRFYQGVTFLNQSIEGDTLITEVLFNTKGYLSRINWKRSKRLLYGSLLCFTGNLFKSLFLGVIVERNIKQLEQGILRCKLIGAEDGEIFGKEFMMAESEVYFEAYQHVLRGLKNFNEQNFPLKEYIINVSSEHHLPSYLARNPEAVYSYQGFTFPVVDSDKWPNIRELEVNESQFKALHSALTKKCAVIQGPPGTGKTYIGLIIAKILLENSSFWRGFDNGPILVVCFTNHALDQFLEGILTFTKEVVRVGGQSKSENLDEYNLRSFRRKTGVKSYALKEVEKKLEQCSTELNSNFIIIKELQKHSGILSLNLLQEGMEMKHSEWFKHEGNWDDDFLVGWLMADHFFTHCPNDVAEMDEIEPISECMMSIFAQSLQNVQNAMNELEEKAKASCAFVPYKVCSIIMLHKKYFNYLKMNLMVRKRNDDYILSKLAEVTDLHTLEPELRWSLYNHWLSQTLKFYERRLHRMRSVYQRLSQQKLEILDHMNLEAIRRADVVGMTTTGAAKNQTLIQLLGSKIVIVEEAAEALESHITVSLSPQCEHLILIGDHKQLRPNNAVYKLAKDYHLNVSLFERLLMNDVSFETLKIQHRMRPDIADLIIPAIYPVLQNHPVVMNYDSIMGLRMNLYFINHTNFEETAIDDLSKKNPHEAKFLIALCRHLILQGYDSHQITILTSYLGQLFCLMEEKEKNNITKNVRIAVVDNYQGEENDIILLSLVRNNNEGKIGFLGNDNRICVALSRAKKGLFIMGNIEMLAEKSHLWSEIRKVLQKKEAIGTHLTLQCLKHPEQLTKVSKAEDFNGITEGGCTQMCGQSMNCGHICKKICHAQGHDDFRCQEICNKVMCTRDHRCQKLCWVSCGDCKVTVEVNLPCGHMANLPCHKDPFEYKCPEMVVAKLPDCEHETKKLCHLAITTVSCPFPCGGRLLCGHACAKKCHVNRDPDHLDYKCHRNCTKKNVNCQREHICQKKCFEECVKCPIKIKRKFPGCDHFADMLCSQNPDKIECNRICHKKLDCGHNCPRLCKNPCGGCQKIVKKEIPDCKHTINMKCCEIPVRRMCKKKCKRTLSCGHTCTGICGNPCSVKKCESFSSKTAKALCGHDVMLFCHEVSSAPDTKTLMERCEGDCNAVLKCSHKCKGTCGKCHQGRIHVPCQEYCGKNLICGHKCTVMCSMICPPCSKRCYIQCEHSKCRYLCGRPCPLCKEKCLWRCKHFSCGKKCSEICDRPPCNEPCKRKLKCEHQCIGFCGEKCPTLCKICNPNELDEILDFFATDALGENARYVELPDCGHVFESTGLDQWFSRRDEVVKMLQCPQCRTPVQKAHRYGNVAKMNFNNVLKIKRKVFGSLRPTRDFLLNSLNKLTPLLNTIEFRPSWKFLSELEDLIKRNRRECFNVFFLNSLQVRTQCVLSITDLFIELKAKISQDALQDCTKLVNLLICTMLKIREHISPQEQSDFEGECMRFHLTMQLRALENTNGFKNFARTEWYKDYDGCRELVQTVKAFEKEKYMETNTKIREVYKTLANGHIGLSKTEMEQIVSAINLHQGHWILCPNGHVFVITECGGAVTEGRCNECNERIGGTDHSLLQSNTRLQNMPEGL